LLPGLAALVLMTGCARPQWMSQTPPPGANREAAQPPEDAIALNRLRAYWPQPDDQAEQDRFRHERVARLELPPLFNGQRLLLVYASRRTGYDCNACSPELSFFEFQTGRDAQAPVLHMASLAAIALGYAGVAPSVRLQTFRSGHYAVVLTWEEFAQGSTTMLSVLTNGEGLMHEVLRQEIGGSHDLQIVPGQIIGLDWFTDFRLDGQRVRHPAGK
jgi:hypothetical protein